MVRFRVWILLPQMQCLTCHYITTNLSLWERKNTFIHTHTHTAYNQPVAFTGSTLATELCLCREWDLSSFVSRKIDKVPSLYYIQMRATQILSSAKLLPFGLLLLCCRFATINAVHSWAKIKILECCRFQPPNYKTFHKNAEFPSCFNIKKIDINSIDVHFILSSFSFGALLIKYCCCFA